MMSPKNLTRRRCAYAKLCLFRKVEHVQGAVIAERCPSPPFTTMLESDLQSMASPFELSFSSEISTSFLLADSGIEGIICLFSAWNAAS
jgi:hypothetical protein